ncbi:CAP domain-containing protein [Roseibium sediminis]|uniref:CAP domain-containing protein n=1 Tax=Roseibium sediminis TaxID=1775174 RepID=UPI00123E15F9|nr:CAP domain-containing protein [Roseibium sediminis]
MKLQPRLTYFAALVLAGMLTAFIPACRSLPSQKEVVEETVITVVAVDQTALLSLLNAYRADRGLDPLQLDATLNHVSVEMARHIAERDSMDTWAHSVFGLSSRLDKAGYANYAAAENLGAGYADLNAAFAGWQGSEGHNKNLLNPHVTRVGIGRTLRSNGKWRNFWALTLARPKEDGRPVVATR